MDHQQEVEASEAQTAREQAACSKQHAAEVASREATVRSMRHQMGVEHNAEVGNRKLTHEQFLYNAAVEHNNEVAYREANVAKMQREHKDWQAWREHREQVEANNQDKRYKAIEQWLAEREKEEVANGDNRQRHLEAWIAATQQANANNADKCAAAWEANRAAREKAIAQKQKEREAEAKGVQVPEGAGGPPEPPLEGEGAKIASYGEQLSETQLRVAGQIMQFWINHGFPAAAAAGFVGNAVAESSLHVHEAGGGLYQQSGYPASDSAGTVDEQSNHVREHLGAGLTSDLKKVTNAKHAAYLIMVYYEKPEGSQPGEGSVADVAKLSEREEWAQWALAWWGAGKAIEGISKGAEGIAHFTGEAWEKTKVGGKAHEVWGYVQQAIGNELVATHGHLETLKHHKLKEG